jgi:hypothetical protein
MPSNTQTFRKYLNPVFIETGSEQGYGIQQAIEVGFNRIFSIELNHASYLYCLKKYVQNKDVTLIHGDSSYVLGELLPVINECCTFWLDGHNIDSYPLIAELDAIKQHHIKNHIILIDDLRMLDEQKHGLSTEILKKKILEINPDYNFSFENGHIANDILVAYVN